MVSSNRDAPGDNRAPGQGRSARFEPGPLHGVKRKRDDRIPRSGSIANGTTNGIKFHNHINGNSSQQQNIRPSNPPKSKPNASKSPLSEKSRLLLQARKKLPIWSHVSEIRLGLQGSRDVMILVGETGSGKSTQVPQLLLDESWCKGCVAITQPRRVAAVTLARRVADEMGTPLGSASPASKVGYSVRFDNNTGPGTRIKFLTEGMLLQEMLRDPWLRQYSAVIVDEVHERGVNVDLILGFLRRIVTGDKKGRKGVPLKTVIMSATADTEALFNFFEQGYNSKAPAQHVNGNPDTHNGDDATSESSWSGLSSSDESTPMGPPNDVSQNMKMSFTEVSSEHISTCYIEGRQHPVEILYTPEATPDYAEAALKTIFQIHYKEPLPGDVLVFLTGQDVVESLENLVNEHGAAMGPEVPKILALPLFAALPRAAQQSVFQSAPSNTRKVILSTNIAETSVTIPGVRHVIDCGLAKIKEFRPQLGLDSLLVKPISQSSAIQRKGRAGREAPGKCYRLYTEREYLKLIPANVPEMLRCDLASALLTMKARGVDDIIDFPFLSPPAPTALRTALLHLHRLSALAENGRITPSGLAMARLPLPPPLARVLITAATPVYDVVADVIDIVACLTVESIFLPPPSEDAREEAASARRDLLRREGDHLTLLATLQAYAAEQTDRRGWCDRRGVSHRAMRNVLDVRKQLTAQCAMQRLLPASTAADGEAKGETSSYTPERGATVLRAFLQGFAGNVARLMPDGGYRTLEGNQTVAIHPSSVLFGRKVEAILYNELVFTSKCYARGVSAVRMDWWGEAVGAA